MKNKIGILGSGGAVGNIIVKELKKNGFKLKCGHRNIKHNPKVDGVESIPVDVLNDRELSLFLKDCDLVVNATGPSYITSPNIARIASEFGIKYVDVFGVVLIDDEKTSNIASVIGTGNFPGLSGIILKWINEKYSKNLKRVHIYAGGHEKVTVNACFDVLMSSLKGYVETNCFISFGNKKKISRTKNLASENRFEFLSPSDAVMTKHISEELLQVSKRFPNNEIYWNNVMNSEYYKILRWGISQIQKEYSFNEIFKVASGISERISCTESIENEQFHYSYQCNIILDSCFGEYEEFIEILCGDTYLINGYLTSLIVMELINRSNINRAMWAFEIFDSSFILEELIYKNVILDIKINGKSIKEEICVRQERGEI